MRREFAVNSCVNEVEAQIGMPIKTYFRKAVKRGLGQREMAKELKLSPTTVNHWMQKLGFEPVKTYREVA